MNINTVIIVVQFIFTIIIGIYFYTQLKNQEVSRVSIEKESKKKLEKLYKMRKIKLTEPLAEKTRPTSLNEIVGQEEGIKALKAALCGPNPQHVIVYGPPGVGKTAAARVILEEAKKMKISPFEKDAKFVEMDATTLRFDERGIADPLIGSVHDPIYQGAGAYGAAGVPQPKPGAVTKAHGGILFLDEIGELHPIQLNKLLKVLEDRKVLLESSYYSSENKHIPSYIHDIFQNGLPADFRLVGATTRRPEEISPAIRSRCTEIFFKSLKPNEIIQIARKCANKAEFELEEGVTNLISRYANNGRDAINILQTAGCLSVIDNRKKIKINDVEWVLEFGQYSPKILKKIEKCNRIGCVNALGVFGMGMGNLIEVEVISKSTKNKKKGNLIMTGFIDEEEINRGNSKLKRESTSKASIENVLTVINNLTDINYQNYDIHINIPGGIPVDGPSAGTAIFTAVYSSLMSKKVNSEIAMTGELSITGKILPVGGVQAKISAACEAGVKKVFIPKDNWKESYNNYTIKVIPVENIEQIINKVFDEREGIIIENIKNQKEILTAQSM